MTSLIEDGKKYIMNTYNFLPLVIDRGEGVYLYDSEGNKYLDFVSGIAVNTLGYNNPKLEKALLEQFKKIHHCSNLYMTEPNVNLAKKLVESTDFDKAFFCNSGAESIESALKLSRKYSYVNYGNEDRYEIIAMKNSFHGRTMGSVTATGQTKYQKGFGPLLPDIKHIEYNNIEALKNAITENTCAILMEVIQGEGGICPVDKEFIKKARELADEKDLVLIFDEVQTGIGRTGKLFGYENFRVVPDILCMAKGLAGGVPMGGILAKEKIASAFVPGDHASTFGGNPLSSIMALTVLEELIDNKLLDNVVVQGENLRLGLEKLKEKYSIIQDIRGYGLILGIEVPETKVKDIIVKTMEKGLLLIGAGSNVVRFVPPLIINESEIEEGLKILEEIIKDMDKK